MLGLQERFNPEKVMKAMKLFIPHPRRMFAWPRIITRDAFLTNR